MDRDEIHHKMSKKVAQLTKVIFHLNTRNEEADLHLTAVTNAYEKEVEAILRDANGKVKKMSQDVEKLRSDSCKEQVAEVARKFDSERKQGLRELQDLRTAVTDREQKNIATWSDRVNKMQTELFAVRDRCVQQATQFKAALAEKENLLQADQKDLLGRHAHELEQLKAAHKHELEDAQSQMAQEAELRRLAEQKLAEEEALQLQQQVADLRRAADEERSRFAKREADVQASEGNLRRALEDFQNKAKASEEAFQRELSAKEQALREGQEELAAQKAEVARLQDLIGKTMEEGMQAKMAEMESLRLAHASELKAKNSAHDEALRQLQAQHQLALNQVAELKQVASEERNRHAAREAELQQSIQDLQNKATAADKAYQQELATREQALKERQEELAAQQAEVARMQDLMGKTMEEGVQAKMAEMEALRAAHASELETARSANEQALRQQQEQYELVLRQVAELKQAASEESSRVAAGEAELRQSMQELQSKANAAEEAYQQELLAREQALKERQAELAAQKDEVTRLQELIGKTMEEGMQAKTAEMDALRAAHASELQAAKSAHEQTLRQFQEQHDLVLRQVAELESAANEERSRVSAREAELLQTGQAKSALQAELEELRRQLLSEKERHQVAVEGKQKELKRLQEEMDSLQRRLSDQSQAAEEARTSAEGSYQQERLQLLRQIDEARTEGVEMVQRLSAEHQNKLTEVYDQHREQLEKVRESLSTSHKAQMEELRQKHQQEVEGLKTKHTAALQDAKDSHERQMEEARAKHAAAVEALEATAKQEAARHAEEVAELNSKLSKESEALAKERARTQQLEQSLNESQATIGSLNMKMRSMEESHSAAVKKMEEDFAKERVGLKEKHKAAVDGLLKEQTKEILALKEQFDRARQIQEMQVEMLKSKLQELQEMYDNRPPREEDLRKIAELQAEVRERENIIRKQLDEMQFYKLELINREQNYNKVFGANPTIGVMNPLAAKKGGVK